MKDLCLVICSIFFLQLLSAQSVTIQVDGEDLYYTEPGCGDCYSSSDPRWRSRINIQGSQYDWDTEREDVTCGWQSMTNYSWTPTISKQATDNIVFSFTGYEDDNFICGGNDNECGGYSTLRTINNICD